MSRAKVWSGNGGSGAFGIQDPSRVNNREEGGVVGSRRTMAGAARGRGEFDRFWERSASGFRGKFRPGFSLGGRELVETVAAEGVRVCCASM